LGGAMNIRRQQRRLAWVSLVSLVLMVGLPRATALGEMPEPPMGLAAVKPAVPMAAFSLPSLHGSEFASSSLNGKVVVVRFWATW
jgi:cytochrome oxidase Cu insertion factor (SCO1/SenC/PrrC family)